MISVRAIKSAQKDLKNELIAILMKDLQETLKENIQKQLKEYQDNTNKNVRRHRKYDINSIRIQQAPKQN
jgi:hypothetical protein